MPPSRLLLVVSIAFSPFFVNSFFCSRVYRSYFVNEKLASSQNINEWITSTQSASKNEGTKITVENLDGRFICRAKSAIQKGETIFTLPQGLCLDASKGFRIPNGFRLRTGDQGVLALLLLSEKNLGSKSKYAAYINNLPKQPDGFASWSPEVIVEYIKSTTRDIKSQLRAVEDDFTVLQNLDISKEIHANGALKKADFTWALAIVRSRSVFLDGMCTLVPGMDFMKFDPLCEADPYITSAGMFGGKVVKVNADRGYAQGDEVFMSYGLKGSSECLQDHGFVPDIALDDSCCEMVVSIDENDKYPDDKISILEKAGLRRKESFELESNVEAEVDPQLIRFLRLKLISGKDSFILESCFSNTVFQTLSLPFSKPNEIDVVKYVISFCERMLQKINSVKSPEEDMAMAKQYDGVTGELPVSVELARLRVQERAALQETLVKIEKELLYLQGPADTNEYYQERRLRDLDLLRPLDESEIVVVGEVDRSSRY